MSDRPIIGMTVGDAAGVGTEIILKAVHRADLYDRCRPIVIGDQKIMERAETFVRTGLGIHPVSSVGEATFQQGQVDVLDLGLLSPELPVGQVSPQAGDAAFRYLEMAIRLAQDGQLDAICTAPLNKEALQQGGHRYPGHTEILADLTGTDDYSMMLSAPKLKVIHVTTHVGLLEAVRMIQPDRVYRVIRLAHDTLSRAGIAKPRIAVCGINPHAGENGLFGNGEEEEKVVPAVEKAKEEGIDVEGP